MFHTARRGRRAVAAGLTALLLAAAARATEHTTFEPLWMAPDDNETDVVHTLPGLISLPPGWQPGGGAAIMIGAPEVPGGPRDGVVSRLLGEGALVLELDVFTARGYAADSGAAPSPPDAAALAHDLFAALRVLRREYDPGLVVSLGFGLGGEAALRAATMRLPRGVTGFVAGADLESRPTRFAPGAPPDGAEAWSLRVRSLCRALTEPAAADADMAARRCEAALNGQAAQAAWR